MDSPILCFCCQLCYHDDAAQHAIKVPAASKPCIAFAAASGICAALQPVHDAYRRRRKKQQQLPRLPRKLPPRRPRPRRQLPALGHLPRSPRQRRQPRLLLLHMRTQRRSLMMRSMLDCYPHYI